jgi:hypothetical protein
VLSLYPGLAACLEESLQSLVPETTDHAGYCNLWRYGLQEAAYACDSCELNADPGRCPAYSAQPVVAGARQIRSLDHPVGAEKDRVWNFQTQR